MKMREIWNSRLECVLGEGDSGLRPVKAWELYFVSLIFLSKVFPGKEIIQNPGVGPRRSELIIWRKQIQVVQGIDRCGCCGVPHRYPVKTEILLSSAVCIGCQWLQLNFSLKIALGKKEIFLVKNCAPTLVAAQIQWLVNVGVHRSGPLPQFHKA